MYGDVRVTDGVYLVTKYSIYNVIIAIIIDDVVVVVVSALGY